MRASRNCINLSLALSLGLCLTFQQGALAQESKLDRMDATAQSAFEQGDYKRASTSFNKLLTELNKDIDSLDKDAQTARKQQAMKTMRRLGQCALAQKDFVSATDLLNKAREASVELAQADSDLDKAFAELSANYREIDPSTLGTEASAALKEVGASKIGVAKTDGGEHIEVTLSEKVVKPINAPGVSHVGFDKTIAFDFNETPDGTVQISNISGLKAKVKVWVDIIASKLSLDAEQKPVAQVTGAKMGISQSVSTKLPDEIYQPIIALIGKVKNVFSDNAGPGSTYENVATGGAQSGGNATSTEIVPVVNSGTQPAVDPSLQPLAPADNSPANSNE